MKVMTVVGARPQFVKASVVSAAIAGRPGLTEVLVHTGQHYDAAMSDVFFAELGLRLPEHHLGVGSGSHGEQTGEMLIRIEQAVMAESPDMVLTYGDTNSTIAAALCAAKLGISLAHVEAGLRSFNRAMPEEVNRVVTDHLSDLLFCPSVVSVANLAAEGIHRHVHEVGDVMYDAFLRFSSALPERDRRVGRRLGLVDGEYAVVTLHRQGNTDVVDRFARIIDGISRAAASGRQIVWPVHPRLRDRLEGLSLPSAVVTIEPLGYLDMLELVRGAAVVATDSGGLQKEAYWAAVPCVTMREETEWTETVAEGWNVIVDDDPDAIAAALLASRAGTGDRLAYGDGRASERIAELLESFMGGS